MYYPQNTQSINTVILSFDGVMTSLSKLRYNYYRRFCKLYDQHLDNELYYEQCHSFKTMYNHSPIPSKLITQDALSKKVEEDLYAYSLNHGIKIHDGFDELFDLIRSKKMNLIYTSTHPKKYTEPLFVLTGSLYRPHEFYYDDLSVYEQHKDHANEVLVIASDIHTLKLANKYRYNVIYYPAVQDENDEITIRSLAVIHHLIEAINLILDKWREPRHQYLLINNENSLDDSYQTLLKTSNSTLHKAITSIYTVEKSEPIEVEIKEETSMHETETIEEPTLPLLEDSEELFENTMIFNFSKEELDEEEEQNFTLEPLEEVAKDTHTDLDSIIKELNEREENLTNTKIFSKEELKEFGVREEDLYNEDLDDDQEVQVPIIKILFNSFIYAIIDSIIVLLAYLALTIGLYDWIFKVNAPLSFIQTIIKTVYDISMHLFGAFASSIGQSINASATLVEGIAVFTFITLIFWIYIFISEIIKSKKHTK